MGARPLMMSLRLKDVEWIKFELGSQMLDGDGFFMSKICPPRRPESGLCGLDHERRECSGVDLGSPLCNLESSAVVAGIAGQPMLWEVVHPRAEVLSLSGPSPASRCLMLQGFGACGAVWTRSIFR